MPNQPTQIKEPTDRIKELARVNDWHYGLLSRAMAVIGPSKSEEAVLLALQEAADNISLAAIRGGSADHPDNQALKLKGAKVFGYRSVADFDEACKRPFPGYYRGKYPLADDARSEPPAFCQPCDLKVGDVVTFTNDQGVAFHHHVVTGFAPQAEHGRFVYYDSDSWWFPVSPESLTLEHDTEYYVWCDDDCQNKTASLEEAKKWRDEFVADGCVSWIVDSDDNYITDGEVDYAHVEVITAEGELLEWLVAKCLGHIGPDNRLRDEYCDSLRHDQDGGFLDDMARSAAIIWDRKIDLRFDRDRVFDPGEKVEQWYASKPIDTGIDTEWLAYGETPLVAGLRCLVMSEIGEQVSVPKDFLAQLSPRYQLEQDAGHGETVDAPAP